MNISDSERITSVLENLGLKKSQKMKEADLIVINMCSVRQSAVDRVYGLIIKLQSLNLKSQTILTGCILKKDKKKMSSFFNYVLDIKDLSCWSKALNFKKEIKRDYLKITPRYSNSFSVNIPIMTGCNNFCAYCVVPYTRNKEISRPSNDIVKEVENAVEKGAKEIWLLGQNVNSYKDGKTTFPKLLEKINKIPGDFWIRFTSSHPKDFKDSLIKTMKTCKKTAPYLNLPVQSGDNEILKKMNRIYTIEDYKEIVEKLKKEIPNIALSTDVIVGFPTETKKQFQNTVNLFKEIKYDMAYISKYSRRAQTEAFKLKDDVSIKEKIKRERILNKIVAKTAFENNRKYIGEITDVLIDSETKNNSWLGKTKEYKTVKISQKIKNEKLMGELVKVKITKASLWGLKGELV